MEVILTFESEERKEISLKMDVLNTDIAKRWFCAFMYNVKNKYQLEKFRSLYGLHKGPRNAKFLIQKLNEYILIINKFSNDGGWDKTYTIDEVYSVETLLNDDGSINQELFNILHHHFEILRGQAWNESEFALKAPKNISIAIDRLNSICHELEGLISSKMVEKKNIFSASHILSFKHNPVFDLQSSDYDSFDLDFEFGGVYLHYCQSGKRHWEAFEDNDSVVEDSNISGLRFYSGECDIYWGPDTEYKNSEREKEFHTWLNSHNLDPSNKKLSLGQLKVAQFDRKKNFENMSDLEINRLLNEHYSLTKISLIDGEEVVSNSYPSSVFDDDFDLTDEVPKEEIPFIIFPDIPTTLGYLELKKLNMKL